MIYVHLYCIIVHENLKFYFILKHTLYEQRHTTSQSKRRRETDKICLDRSLVRYVIRKKSRTGYRVQWLLASRLASLNPIQDSAAYRDIQFKIYRINKPVQKKKNDP